MNIQEQVSQQRVKHIVNSYQLQGQDGAQFDESLADLLRAYPTPLIELALTETLVDVWLTVPLVRGNAFLKQAQQKLKTWEAQAITSTITPEQFNQITGLDPSPVFGSSGLPPAQPTARPL